MNVLSSLLVVLALLLASCQNESRAPARAGGDAASKAATSATPASYTGRVIETMDAGGYTYVNLDTGQGTVWAAAPECEVQMGQELTIATMMPMANFHSDTLDRTFDRLYFVNGFTKGKPQDAVLPPDWKHGKATATPPADVDLTGIDKAEGGFRVAEVYQRQSDLEGKEVQVRGRVVKFLPAIMGKNWLHVRDGSGEEGTNDLTVTTSRQVKIGDLVLVRGVLSVDKDFGAGYRYEVIVEDAHVDVQ